MFSSAELADLRATQYDSLLDTCTINSYSVTYNSFGEPVETWIPGSGLSCGLEMVNTSKNYKDEFTDIKIDAVIRLPFGTVIDPRDKITITHRFGEVLASGIQYEIAGNSKDGISGIRVPLKILDQ